MSGPRVPGSPDTGLRFLRSIAERLGADRIVEVHLLPPLRQGRIESAVAIVAVADEPSNPPADMSESQAGTDSHGLAESEERPSPELQREGEGEGPRHTIYTAAYRYTRKGPDRGAWAVDVVAQADAPLEALPAVIRGVQRRSDGLWTSLQVASGEAWPQADRLSGADLRALIADGPADVRTGSSPRRVDGSSDGTATAAEGGAA